MFAKEAQQRRPDQEGKIAGYRYHADALRRIGTGVAGGGNGQRETERCAKTPQQYRDAGHPRVVDEDNQADTQRAPSRRWARDYRDPAVAIDKPAAGKATYCHPEGEAGCKSRSRRWG